MVQASRSQSQRRQHVEDDEASDVAPGTQERVFSEEAAEGDGPGLCDEPGRPSASELASTPLQVLSSARSQDPVVPDADEAVGQDVLEEEL